MKKSRTSVKSKVSSRRGKKPLTALNGNRRGRSTSQRSRANKAWFVKAMDATLHFTDSRRSELSGFLFIASGLFFLLALIPGESNLLGRVGAVIFKLLFMGFGLFSLGVPVTLISVGFSRLKRTEVHAPAVRAAGWILMLLSLSTLLHLLAPATLEKGSAKGMWLAGWLGRGQAEFLVQWLALVGTVVLELILLGVALYLLGKEDLVKNSVLQSYEKLRILWLSWRERGSQDMEELPRIARAVRKKEKKSEAADEAMVKAEETIAEESVPPVDREAAAAAFLKQRQAIKINEGGPKVNASASSEGLSGAQAEQTFKSQMERYKLPPASLLLKTEKQTAGVVDYKQVSADLEKVMASFGVTARVVEVCPGPSVTRYEITLAPGIKMNRVVTLADDIALGAKVSSVRIEGPIHGKGTLGLEIPNAKAQMVGMRELVETQEFKDTGQKLVFALGKDIGGSMIFPNLAEMPHLLVAGATGSGKSVCLNSIITSILFKAAPDEVRFLMVDPKRVELTPYDMIPHLIRPVVTNPKEAAGALRLMVVEMEDRYKKLAKAGMRKIDDYNAWIAKLEAEKEQLEAIPDAEMQEIPKEENPHVRLPYIVVIVDELADLMMVSANEVESSIARLAQMARGVGIHLVIATQRPSVDVITGVIKANLPSRIAFQVSSKIDSRTILDGSGADALLGKGDMLYSPYNVNKPIRVQGCFLSSGEVADVVRHVKKQADPVFDNRFENLKVVAADSANGGGEGGGADEDSLYEEAVQCVIRAGQASTSILQRRLRVGYGRAARLLDAMEQEGIISAPDGNRPRKVLLNPEDYTDQNPAQAESLEEL